MTLATWITLIVAILGVLHGPLAVQLLKAIGGKKAAK